MDQTLGETLFHMVTYVFDNCNLSQEIFAHAIDAWRAIIYFWDMVPSTCLRSFQLYGDKASLHESIYDLRNIPKCISVSTYRLIASACKVKCFSI